MNTFDELISDIRKEWNKAEKAIKHAESIDGEVTNPSVFELRYAGRRLIEALDCRGQDEARSIALLRDALFDCHRARHDAIDAATSKMAGDLGVATEYLSATVLMQNFPDFSEFYAEMLTVRTLIAESRENRDNRDKIYETIETSKLDRLVDLYGRFRACEPLMLKAMEQEKADRKANRRDGKWGRIREYPKLCV